jgi:hypothetical protein
MTAAISDEVRRTAPLALWRYAHEYLRAARALCRQISVRSSESQVPYLIAAQGIEFALKAFLRTRGATMVDLRNDIGHSLLAALTRSEELGLPPMPDRCRAAVALLAPCHQDEQFVYLSAPAKAFPDIDPLVDAGVWILDRIAPDVVEHFVLHLAGDASPTVPQFLQRMRADLSATSDIVNVQPPDTADAAGDLGESVPPGAPEDKPGRH